LERRARLGLGWQLQTDQADDNESEKDPAKYEKLFEMKPTGQTDCAVLLDGSACGISHNARWRANGGWWGEFGEEGKG
jgi:hypothetical protein